MTISPWQLRRLLQGPAPAQPLPPLRSMQVAGGLISRQEWALACAAVTPNVYVGYGCNEIGAITLLRPGVEMRSPGLVGRLVEGVEARADGPLGDRLATGEVGDLGFRAAWMCSRYAGNPPATREHFRDGWFYPGLAGSLDTQCNLTLHGRTREMINYGGLKIWPDEIEAVLKQHPDVLDAALVGLPDPESGQLPGAFVVPRAASAGKLNARLDQAELRGFCAARIDAARVPPVFFEVSEIPRDQAGKIQREALIEVYLRTFGGAGGGDA